MIHFLFSALGPELKLFLVVISIVGPLTIGILVLIIKRIEKDTPDRIRWR